MYKKVELKENGFVGMEHEVANLWKEKDIIQSHMWPLTPADIPHSREAALVCIADKMSSSYETVLERRAQRKENRR